MKKLVHTIQLISLLLFFYDSNAQTLFINEIMASNSTGIKDESNSYEGWFEIYNDGATAIDLGGYYVTDNSGNLIKFQIPTTNSAQTTIASKGFKRFWASDHPERGVLHVGFGLSASGEDLVLVAPNGVDILDQILFGPQQPNISYGRKTNGGSEWVFFSTSTPGASNATGVVINRVDPPVFSHESGFYASAFSLALSHTDPSVTIYYTLDGSDPKVEHLTAQYFPYKPIYKETGTPTDQDIAMQRFITETYSPSSPIAIVDGLPRPNQLAAKASSIADSPSYRSPTNNPKGMVVRAIAVKAGLAPSRIITKTYFVTAEGVSPYKMPVISLVSNESFFFDYNSGMYTPGTHYDSWRRENPSAGIGVCPIGNFGFSGVGWERTGNVEFFVNNQTTINQEIEFRIHGGCTRAYPRKTLRLYSRTQFGNGVFPEKPSLEPRRLLLRNSGNDWSSTIFRDAFYQKLVQHLSFDTQRSRPAVVYLNSEYWGIHNIRERLDGHYLEDKYDVDRDEVDMITPEGGLLEVDEGDVINYNALTTFVDNNSFVTTANYNALVEKIDIENFTDYQIAEVFCANSDWPFKNLKMWRKRTAYNPSAKLGHDGRWRWMLYDTDISLGMWNAVGFDNLAQAIKNESSSRILHKLVANSEYKAFFINRFADLLNTTFLATRTDTVLTNFKKLYEADMPQHINRWKVPVSIPGWESSINSIASFLSARSENIRNHIRSNFSAGANRDLTVNVSNVTMGHVKVNTIDIENGTVGVKPQPYPWTGIYFDGIPVKLLAKPKPGYKFERWEEGGSSIATEPELTINLTSNRTLVAVFEIDPLYNSIPLSHNLAAGNYSFTNWPEASTPGTFPPSMAFVLMSADDPVLTSVIGGGLDGGKNFVEGAYNHSSSARVNGLGDDGVAFINTSGSSNTGYFGQKVGGALLALNTTGVTDARVAWTGGTVLPNNQIYALRLQYRVGDTGDFKDVLEVGNPEYVRNATAGHNQSFGPTSLPAEAIGKPYVQLFWRYYLTTSGSSTRAQLRLDEISVTSSSNPLPVVLTSFRAQAQEKATLLTWSTSMEENTNSFGIERSTTGKTWRVIGNVPASFSSNSTVNYNFTDSSPAFGQNLYRLKMEDQDGSFSHSSIVSVSFTGEGGVKLFPNPASDYIEIETPDWEEVNGIYLYDMAGRILSRVERKTDSVGLSNKLNLRGFPAGIYRLGLIRSNGESSNHPILLVH